MRVEPMLPQQGYSDDPRCAAIPGVMHSKMHLISEIYILD
jgi:hypothetical protein